MTITSLPARRELAQLLGGSASVAWLQIHQLSHEVATLSNSFGGLQGQAPTPAEYGRAIQTAKERLRLVLHELIGVSVTLGRAEMLAELAASSSDG